MKHRTFVKGLATATALPVVGGGIFLRVGTDDTDSSPVIVGNLAAGLEGLGDEVDPMMCWDAPHGVNYDDGPLFIEWIAKVTGYTK